MPSFDERTILDFVRHVKTIEASYKTIRIRTLFADRDRGGTLTPALTRVDLLSEEIDESCSHYWTTRSLKFSEKYMRYTSIENLIEALISGSLNIEESSVGYFETEEAGWIYRVSRPDSNLELLIDSKSLVLSGSRRIESSLDGTEPHFENELQLHPRITFSSISEMCQHFLNMEYTSLKEKIVKIFAPSYLSIQSLHFHQNRLTFKLSCHRNIVSNLRAWIVFKSPNGNLVQHPLRFRSPTIRDIPNNFAEVEKSITVPPSARDSSTARLTVSITGIETIALDSKGCINWPVANKIRASLDFLDSTKVGKYFDISNFESTYISLSGGQDDLILESVVAAAFSSCGFEVLWTGIFKLSCEDILVFIPNSNKVLVVECTVGTASRKIGQMRTALRDLRNKSDWLEFIGIVITSNLSTDEERTSAQRDGIILLDVSELKTFIQMTNDPPNTERILTWLGIQ